jgi:cytoskeletal protein CcmA (bactofilin family)
MQNPKVPDNEKETIVEDGTLLDGTLVSSCGIVVNGKIRGEVTAPSLRVNGTGSVHGKAKVDQIVSRGELSGEFEADLVQLAGVVRDETVLRANSLEVQLAMGDRESVVFGTCSLEVGEMPDKEAAIRASMMGDAGTPPADGPPPPAAPEPELSAAAEARAMVRRKTVPPGKEATSRDKMG